MSKQMDKYLSQQMLICPNKCYFGDKYLSTDFGFVGSNFVRGRGVNRYATMHPWGKPHRLPGPLSATLKEAARKLPVGTVLGS